MWKALIKLVLSWSYRCEHDWENMVQNNVFNDGNTDKIPDKIIYTYRCKKCCEFKKTYT